MADWIGVDVSNDTQTWTCGHCGKRCERQRVRGQRPKWCSDECGWKARGMKSGTCAHCGVEYMGYSGTFCSVACARRARPKKAPPPPKPKAAPADLRSPLRRAIEEVDAPGVLSAIMARTARNPDGCLEWQGRMKDGYPIVNVGGRWLAVHRLALEASMGGPLGSQPAHHICANPRCVNPDHLQPVTHRDNIAEMLARNAYLARIRELEEALASVAPSHPLLLVLPVA